MFHCLKKFLSPYKDLEIVANCDVSYEPSIGIPDIQTAMGKLAGVYPLVKKGGDYFVARSLKPDPKLKTIAGHVDDHSETIHYALGRKIIPVVHGDDYSSYKIGEIDVTKLEHLFIEGDEELKIPAHHVAFI